MLGMRQIAALLLLVFWSGCCAELEAEPAATRGERVEVVVDVDGMVCDACSKAVVDQLKRTDGVVGSDCSYQTKTAVITFDAGITDFETIQARLTAIGFPVQKSGDSEPPASPEVAPAAGDS
jgi:copper chaperone CopZ